MACPFDKCTMMKLCLSQEYELAARCVDRVLQMEPNNYQAKQLKDLITKKIRRGAYTVGKEGCVCVCVCVCARICTCLGM